MTMNPSAQHSPHTARVTLPPRRVGDGLRLSALGLGTATLGNLYTEVTDSEAYATVSEALASGIRFIDTAPHYGYGLSETRIGDALAQLPHEAVVISTKVGRVVVAAAGHDGLTDGFAVRDNRSVFDYSRDGILRSFEASLKRLRRDRVDILLLHDIGRLTHQERHPLILKQALDEALPAMQRLKEAGACRAIGIGVNEGAVCVEIMGRCALDCILLAGRYTLLEQESLHGVMAEAQRRGVGIIIGGAFNSGLLADVNSPGRTYNYEPVAAETLERAKKIYALCAIQGVDVGAAALQFVLAHPAVVSVVAGMRSAAEVQTAVRRLGLPIPSILWQQLHKAELLLPDAPTP
jgi:D-threo-aldose 1-dehydrogenase